MIDDHPVVKVWKNLGTQWGQVTQVRSYSSLVFTPTYQDVGTWSMSVPFNNQALELQPGRLVTIDWRGTRSTWLFDPIKAASGDDGVPRFEVSGIGALSMLDWPLVLPDPTAAPDAQPNVPVALVGSPEDLMVQVMQAHYKTRYGGVIDLPTSLHRGGTTFQGPSYQKVLELIQALGKAGHLGFDVTLVDTSTTRARLAFKVWQPADKSKAVRLSANIGTLTTWEQVTAAPTATRAFVAGQKPTSGSRFAQWVTTTAATTSATKWGGHREVFVDGPSSTNTAQLNAAGFDALDDGAETRALALVAAEAAGMRAFTHYNVGDIATAEVVTGETIVDSITSITVSDDENGLIVAPTFGNPTATKSTLGLARIIRGLRRRVQKQERK